MSENLDQWTMAQRPDKVTELFLFRTKSELQNDQPDLSPYSMIRLRVILNRLVIQAEQILEEEQFEAIAGKALGTAEGALS